MLSLSMPWEEIIALPQFQDRFSEISEEELNKLKESYEELQSSADDDSSWELPWFPFLFYR